MCSCGSGHKENFCPVCAKYRGYFNVTPVTHSPPIQKKVSGLQRLTILTVRFQEETQPRTTLFDSNKSSYRRKHYPCAIEFVPSEEKSDSGDTNLSDIERDKKKVCFCTEQKPSLAEKLHAKLTNTLSSLPRTVEWSCYDYDYE
jgi:hypothetical protein